MKKEYVNPQMYCTRVQVQTIVCGSPEAYTGSDPEEALAPTRRGMSGDALLL